MPEVPRKTVMVPVTYQSNPQHRDMTPNKSQWTISEQAELAVFESARRNNWLLTSTGWGLHCPAGQANYLGVDRDRLKEVFIAKFTDDTRSNVWHGYPVLNDSGSNRPPHAVLRDWLVMALIRPSTARRVSQGRPCGL